MPKPTIFQGFDGDVPLVQSLGDDITPAREVVTTGAIAIGDTVIMRGGSRIDALQRVKVATVAESVVVPKYPVKILFSTIEEAERVFWVGGDRQEPEQVFALSADATIRGATLTNTGEALEDWIVSLAWTDAGVSGLEPLTYVANIQPDQTVELGVDRAHSYLEPRGNGFWSSRLVAASDLSGGGSGFYGEPTTASVSGEGSTLLYTLTSPTVLSGTLSTTSTFVDLGNQTYTESGSGSNKGLAFWDQALETAIGTSLYSNYRNNASPITEGEALSTHTGSIYVAPALQKVATTNDRGYSFSDGTITPTSGGGGRFSLNRRQRQYNLPETYLCGDQFALVQTRLETFDREVQVADGVTTIIRNINEANEILLLVDRAGDLPDTQLNADLQALLDARSTDPTFNLVSTTVYEADIYNYNNDPEALAFEATILQADVELNINQYDLTAASATPETQTAAVLGLNQADEAEVTIHAASYYPD
jgi:hypothetical protein